MNKGYALFDVDCLEISEDGQGLDFRPRVKPLANKLTQLYEAAELFNFPFLFSTCCSGRMLKPGDFDDIPLHSLRQKRHGVDFKSPQLPPVLHCKKGVWRP